jgi:transposase
MGRYDLTDAQYALLAPELPTNTGKVGAPWAAHRPIINGILWRLHTGTPWADIPARYGAYQTIYDRYTWWRRDGTWEHIVTALQLQLDAHGLIDWSTPGRWSGCWPACAPAARTPPICRERRSGRPRLRHDVQHRTRYVSHRARGLSKEGAHLLLQVRAQALNENLRPSF